MRASNFLLIAFCALACVGPASAQSPQQPRTNPMGTSSQQILAAKITVSDLVKSYEFYTQVIGLKSAYEQQKAPTRAEGAEPTLGQVLLNFSGSLADPYIVLQRRRDDKVTSESAQRIVIEFKVPNAVEAVRRVRDAGYEVVREAPAVKPGEMSIGMVRDPDGYTLELLQAANYPAPSH